MDVISTVRREMRLVRDASEKLLELVCDKVSGTTCRLGVDDEGPIIIESASLDIFNTGPTPARRLCVERLLMRSPDMVITSWCLASSSNDEVSLALSTPRLLATSRGKGFERGEWIR